MIHLTLLKKKDTMSPDKLRVYLEENNCSFEIIEHEEPIKKAYQALKYFPKEKLAPVLVMKSENGLFAYIGSVAHRQTDFKKLQEKLGLKKMKLASKTKILRATRCLVVGRIPLIGHGLPCVFDDTLLAQDFIYGGTGEELKTLKIKPQDVVRLNNVIRHINYQVM